MTVAMLDQIRTIWREAPLATRLGELAFAVMLFLFLIVGLSVAPALDAEIIEWRESVTP